MNKLWPFGGRVRELERDFSRLEAFMHAAPPAHCGWSDSGVQICSEEFCRVLGVETVSSIGDVEAALSAGDAAALEGLFIRLQEQGNPFELTVSTGDGKRTLRLIGARGTDGQEREVFNALWLVDMTELADTALKSAESLRKSEKRESELRGALEALPLPAWLRREDDLSLSWCNRAYARVLETTAATVIAEQRELPISQIKAKKTKGGDDRIRSKGSQDLARRAVTDNVPQHEARHAVIGGDRKLLKIHEIPVQGEQVILGCALDVTAVEELESELNRFMATNAEVLEQLSTAVAIFGPDTRLEFYNTAYASLWHLEEKWLNAKPKLGDILERLREGRRLPEQADFRRFKQGWQDMFTSLINPHEEMLHLPDGTALRLVVTPHPMGGLMVTAEDVTSRLALESSYNTLIAVQKETLDNLAEGLAVFGGDGRLKLWNPAYARLWQFTPETLAKNPHINDIVEAKKGFFEDGEWAAARDEMVACGLERAARTGRIVRADGTLVEYATVPLPDGAVLVTYIDVTDSVRVERALREKNSALEEAERLKLDFLANVSYQLRTPLNAMMGFAEILHNEYFGPLNDRQKEYAEGMLDAGQRLISLINDILDLSTVEAGYLSLYPAEVNIRSMVQSIMKLTEEWARKQELEIKVSLPRNIGKIVADERRLKQVLLNLIRNAINFSEPGGEIKLSAKRDDENVTLIVQDNGIGIPEEDQERIFAPFARASGQPRRSGAGLGLSLVRRIIELHGGHIDIESSPGKGTTVKCILPVKSTLEAERAQP